VQIIEAESSETIEAARVLFQEYASTLDFDLSFQHFDHEMRTFPVQYSSPSGCLLVAYEDESPTGCVGLRKLDEDICEMKRLYVRPRFRGRGIGRALVINVINKGGKLGYGRMRLDTVPSMQEAIALYESFGFKPIPPYRHNPIPGALYFELELRDSD
jgi:ribosomal protein S18 acetylase RimI-like enzyme